jgi:hypothetical protein
LRSIVNGDSMPGPSVIVPVTRIVFTAFILARPPRGLVVLGEKLVHGLRVRDGASSRPRASKHDGLA